MSRRAAFEQEQESVKDKNREKRRARRSRHARVRSKIFGTSEIPRLCVYRSLNHIYAQVIDDNAGRTLASSSSLKLEMPPAERAPEAETEGKSKKTRARPEGIKMRRSRAVGRAIAETAVAKGIKKVAFDRGGYLYHGRVAALAEEARKAGLEF